MRGKPGASRLPPVSKTSFRGHSFVFVLLCVLVAVAYAPVVNLTFLSDDWAVIRLATLPEGEVVWSRILNDFYTPMFDGIPKFRPLYSLSFAVDFLIYGIDPLGYHLTNLALHAVSSFFVYLLALELVPGERARRIAITAAALFVLYPVHPEAVTWISGRVDLICAVFYLPVLLLFARWLRVGNRAYLVSALVLFVPALLAKEMTIALPGLLFLIALHRRRGFAGSIVAVVPFALLLGAYLAARTYILSGIDATGVLGRDLDFTRMLSGFLYRTLHMFVPINFGLLPIEWRAFLNPMFTLWPVPAMVLLAVAYFRGWIKSVFPILMFVLYAVAMIPVLPAVGPDPVLVSSRWSYIPSAFLAILIAYVPWTVFAGHARRSLVAATVVCAVFFAVLLANHGPWLRAGEMTGQLLRVGKEPELPIKYKGAHVFGSRITWISANEPPFKER